MELPNSNNNTLMYVSVSISVVGVRVFFPDLPRTRVDMLTSFFCILWIGSDA